MKRTYVNIRYRLRGSEKAFAFLSGLAGANRYLWNQGIEKIEKDYKETGKSDTREFTLCNWYKDHKWDKANWLADYPTRETRPVMKDLSLAYKAFFKKQRGRPKFKSRRDKWSFPVDLCGSGIKNNNQFLLKKGLVMDMIGIKQLDRYQNAIPKTARVIREVEDRSNPENKLDRNKFKENKWYLYVCYEVDAEEVKAFGNGVGIDRNVRQIAYTNDGKTGEILHMTDVSHIDKRIKILQRRLSKKKKGSNRYERTRLTIAKHKRKKKNIKNNDIRHFAKKVIGKSNLVYLEDLRVKNLVKSAKGTIDNPGKNVKQKKGLNRVIQDSKWSFLKSILEQKGIVNEVSAAYTSQKCSQCGHTEKGNRPTQSKFKCLSCGFSANADINASINIWTSGARNIEKYTRGVLVRPIILRSKRRWANTEKREIGASAL